MMKNHQKTLIGVESYITMSKTIWGISEVSEKMNQRPTVIEIQQTPGQDHSEQWERESMLLEDCATSSYFKKNS